METIQTSMIKNSSVKYKLEVSDNLENKIRFLCDKCHNIEYSGVLFYTYTGNFDNKDLIIKVQDFYLMDIGTGGYTEFNNSSDIVNYMALNPELLDCKIGLLHSHNSMPAYFSGTDINTLREEGLLQENFVSLIVNNKGEYTAAITRKIEGEAVVNFNGLSSLFGDCTYSIKRKDILPKKYLEYFELEVQKPILKYSKDEELENRYKEIKKEKEAAIIKPYDYLSDNLFFDFEKPVKYYSDNKDTTSNLVDYTFYKILSLNPLLSSYRVDISEHLIENTLDSLSYAFPKIEDYSDMLITFIDSAIIPRLLEEKGINLTENIFDRIKDIIDKLQEDMEENEEYNEYLDVLQGTLNNINIRDYGKL